MATQPQRRHVLRGTGAVALGITSAALPSALAAASPLGGAGDGSVPLDATTVTLTPRGYGSTGTTGALEVAWTGVPDATAYTIEARTGAAAYAQVGDPVAAPATSTVLTGLAAGVVHDVRVVASAVDPDLTSSTSAVVSANSSIATGGTIGAYVDGTTTYVVHAFTHSGGAEDQTSHTFTVNREVAVHHLVVGGGGGGGGWSGGGGGAGGLVTSIRIEAGPTVLREGSDPVVRAVGSHEMRVGRGGAGGLAAYDPQGVGEAGADSSAFGTITALGGGAGGTYRFGVSNDPSTVAGAGGSGGGAGSALGGTEQFGGAGEDGQGNAGGDGYAGSTGAGGGGGGGAFEGAFSMRAFNGTSGVRGGDGLPVPIVDAALAAALGVGEVHDGSVHNGVPRPAGVWFAGGGGAGAGIAGDPANSNDGPGGLGGGGRGHRADSTFDPTSEAATQSDPGLPATGGGGGAPGYSQRGAAGGSGVVILRWALPG